MRVRIDILAKPELYNHLAEGIEISTGKKANQFQVTEAMRELIENLVADYVYEEIERFEY
jgi:hypothetical protein